MSGSDSNGQPFPTLPPGVASDGAGAGIPFVSSEGFLRSPEPTKLFANTRGGSEVFFDEFHNSLIGLAAEADLGEQTFKVSGEELDDRFEIVFPCDTRTATVAARQFYSSLQLGKGVWKNQVAIDSAEAEVQYYIHPDKNGAQMRKLWPNICRLFPNLFFPGRFGLERLAPFWLTRGSWSPPPSLSMSMMRGWAGIIVRLLCSNLTPGLIESRFMSEFLVGPGAQSS